MFGISKKKEGHLRAEMARLGIDETDIEETFIRSSGHGGQKCNKTATCVFLRHRLSGVTVKCQQARTQALNRYYARKILAEKLDEQYNRRRSRQQQERARIRRKKRRRSRRAREKMLADKRHRSVKKKLRRPVQRDEDE